MGATGKRGPAGCRNRALIAVLAGAGLRVSEALALRGPDLACDLTSVYVGHGKGKGPNGCQKYRTAGIVEGMRPPIQAWLDLRDRMGIPVTAPLFCTISKGHHGYLITSYVRDLLTRISAKAGIQHVHPHLLRHSHAVGLYRSPGLSVWDISKQLGHASIKTTEVYLAGLDDKEAVEKVAALGNLAG